MLTSALIVSFARFTPKAFQRYFVGAGLALLGVVGVAAKATKFSIAGFSGGLKGMGLMILSCPATNRLRCLRSQIERQRRREGERERGGQTETETETETETDTDNRAVETDRHSTDVDGSNIGTQCTHRTKERSIG